MSMRSKIPLFLKNILENILQRMTTLSRKSLTAQECSSQAVQAIWGDDPIDKIFGK